MKRTQPQTAHVTVNIDNRHFQGCQLSVEEVQSTVHLEYFSNKPLKIGNNNQYTILSI